MFNRFPKYLRLSKIFNPNSLVKKDDIDCWKEGQNLMNTVYLHRIPKLKYTMELYIWNEVSDIFLYCYFSCGKHQKITKLPTRENFEAAKYPREKSWDPWNTCKKKLGTHEIPTRKNLRPTKYPQKKSRPTKYPPEKIEDLQNTHKKNFGPTNYPQRHDGMMVRDPRWHATH